MKGEPRPYIVGHNRRGKTVDELSRVKMRARARHGHARDGSVSRTWKCWRAMKRRCLDPKATGFERYGGRGIAVCTQWLSFDQFLADMGECPDGYSIERINVNGNYEPTNCKWVTPKEQSSNKRNTRRYELNGNVYTLEQLVKISGLNANTLKARLRKQWAVEKAILAPKQRE